MNSPGLANTTVLAVIAIARYHLPVPPDRFQAAQGIPGEAADTVREQTSRRIVAVAHTAMQRQLAISCINGVTSWQISYWREKLCIVSSNS